MSSKGLKERGMDPSTNLTDISADRISIWSSAQKQFIDVGGSYVPVTALTEPAQVSMPNADAVETQLVYISPKAGEVASLDGMVSYIQQQLEIGTGVTRKYYTTNRKTYNFLEIYSPVFITRR